MVTPLISTAGDVRALVAQRILHDGESPATVGDVTLRPHQRAAVERLRHVLREHGGALLADDVGLGKTYVATALIRDAGHTLVVAPAALRDMWRAALARTSTTAQLVSYDALARGRTPVGPFDLLVLDEAHHARNPATRRHAQLAALATGARVLLLSATPIHNSDADLTALLALFLGANARQLTAEQRAAYIVRRERDDVPDLVLPGLRLPQWLDVGDDEPLLELIANLPPPLPPRDGGDAGPLIALSLARLWASSHSALMHAIDRRLARASALRASLASGRYPSRATLTAWTCGDDAMQLAFPQLFGDENRDAESLIPAVTTHTTALEALRHHARDSAWTDLVRARRLREVRAAHGREKIVAFSQFADTVHALFAHLHHDPGTAALTARGGRVAGGRLDRRETLRRFAPLALGAPRPRPIEDIRTLITTDLLSEGVNLHDASVVLHLDLPWTPARLEQRVGRARRLGSYHTHTTVYAMAPPASTETVLRIRQHLLAKLRTTAHALGVAGTILPDLLPTNAELAATPPNPATRRRETLARILDRWLAPSAATPPALDSQHSPPAVVAHVHAPRRFVLALFAEGTTSHLAASLDRAPLDDALDTLLDAAGLADHAPDIHANGAAGETWLPAALELAQRWITRRAATAASGGALPLQAPARRQAMRRIASITARAPHHRRPTLAPLADRARRAVTLPFGLGAERVLHGLATAPLPDEAWLRALGTFADLQERTAQTADQRPRLVAMLVGSPTATS